MEGFSFITTAFSAHLFAEYGGFEESVISAPEHVLPEFLHQVIVEAISSFPPNSLITCRIQTPDHQDCACILWKLPERMDAIEVIECGETTDDLPVPANLLGIFPSSIADAFYDLCELIGDLNHMDDLALELPIFSNLSLVDPFSDPNCLLLSINSGQYLCNPCQLEDVSEWEA